MIQATLRDVNLEEECTCHTTILIPKGDGELGVIGLVEVLKKTVMGVVNRHLMAEIQFHDTLHIFCTGRIMGADSVKVKLLHQLMALR